MLADDRYVEKLATPDVTIADMIGDIDPIKAARMGQDISNELTIYYGFASCKTKRTASKPTFRSRFILKTPA